MNPIHSAGNRLFTGIDYQQNPIDMKMLALFTVKPFLSQVAGVSEVRISGGRTKEYWIRLNVSKMGTLGITPERCDDRT